jgi:hypothetical protein
MMQTWEDAQLGDGCVPSNNTMTLSASRRDLHVRGACRVCSCLSAIRGRAGL